MSATELPIVLKLWAHDVPNSGVDTRGAPDEAADVIKELYRALADLLSIALDEGIVGDNTTIPAALAALKKARGEQVSA